MTVDERVVYACVHTDPDPDMWLLVVLCELTSEGKLTAKELHSILEDW